MIEIYSLAFSFQVSPAAMMMGRTMPLSLCVLFAAVCVSLSTAAGSSHPCSRPCVTGQVMTCRYNFTLEWFRTLGKACYSCPFNVTDCYREECITEDGSMRTVLAINRQVPGPAIEVCEGDSLEIRVVNMLEDGAATSLHWHGQHVKGAPYFDGVGQVTQCHIQHQETFTYRFKAAPAGSHWYHSHTGMQLADGAFGAFVVRQPKGLDPNDNLYDLDLSEHTLLVYDSIPVLSIPRYLDLMHVFDEGLSRNVLVNGRGRKYNVTDTYGVMQTGNKTQALTPLEVIHVQAGKKYRLRVISASPVCPLQVSVDQHQLSVISVDGHPLAPRTLDAFIVHPGERYDFVLSANQSVGNYWIRVIGLGDCEYPQPAANGMAILRYDNASIAEPAGDPTVQRDGVLLNPILFDKTVPAYGYNRSVILTDDMRYHHTNNLTDQRVDVKFIIGMDYNNNDNTVFNSARLYPVQTLPGRMSHATPVMDNITFMLPPVPLLSQKDDVDDSWFCNRSTLTDPEHCLSEDLCMCTHLLKVPLNAVVEAVVFHEGRFFNERGHNMHLHGHSFTVLGVGKIGKSLSRGLLEELDKRGELRRNYVSPPLRDTVNVPDGGYAIIRFVADNPGFWFFHCHTDSHLAQGMALLIKVGDYQDLPPLPEEFPRCGGMGFSNARRLTAQPTTCPTGVGASLQLSAISVLFVVVLAVFRVV